MDHRQRRPKFSSREDHSRRDPIQPFGTYKPKVYKKSVKKMDSNNEILWGSVIGLVLFMILGLYGMYQLELIDWFLRLLG